MDLRLPLLLLLLLSLYLWVELEGMKGSYEELKEEYKALNTSLEEWKGRYYSLQEEKAFLEGKVEELEDAVGMLNQSLRECREERQLLLSNLSNLSEQYAAKEDEIRGLLEEIEEVRRVLYEDVSWFRDNAYLFEKANLLRKRCMEGSLLNVGCLSYYIQDRWHVEYITEEEDRLKSVNETLAQGGDCEDFTLLINAYIRALDPERLVLWKEGTGEFTLYTRGGYEYYLENAKPVYVEREPYLVGVCYLTNIEGNRMEGHCISALSERKPPHIEGAVLFEPQSGEYLGRVGEAIKLCKEEGCSEDIGHIFIIFGEDDFYIFKEGKWESLRGLLEELSRYGNH